MGKITFFVLKSIFVFALFINLATGVSINSGTVLNTSISNSSITFSFNVNVNNFTVESGSVLIYGINFVNQSGTYICNDVLEEAKRAVVPIDFLSLSDVPSYLKQPREQKFLQEIKTSISLNGIIVNRYYLRIPNNLNAEGYQNITNNFKDAISKEKIQMYSFGIYQKV